MPAVQPGDVQGAGQVRYPSLTLSYEYNALTSLTLDMQDHGHQPLISMEDKVHHAVDDHDQYVTHADLPVPLYPHANRVRHALHTQWRCKW